MNKRIIAFLLTVSMLLSLLAVPIAAESFEQNGYSLSNTTLEYSDFLLYADLYRISAVGHQIAGGYACSCFALAYARTMTDGAVHYFYEYNVYGNDQYNVSAAWSSGDYYRTEYTDKTEAFAAIVEELQNRRPVIACVKGRGSTQHFVTVIGFENAEAVSELTEDNFLILDTIPSAPFAAENMGEVGYELKNCGWGSTPSYVIVRPFEIVPLVEIDYAISSNYRYLDFCAYYPSSGNLEISEPCIPYTLPCDPKIAELYDCVSDGRWDSLLAYGETLETIGLYENTSGEYWYRVILGDGTEGFIPAKSTNMTELIPPTLKGGSFPETITGATFLSGEVHTNALLDTIQAKVYKGSVIDGTAVISSDLVSVNGKSYSLKYSMVDYTLPFQDLAKFGSGNYIMTYEVAHTNHYIHRGKLVSESFSEVIAGFPFYYSGKETKEYTVTFDANGGYCSVTTVTVAKDSAIGELPIAEKSGSSFEGWFTAKTGGDAVFAETVILADTVLYAHYVNGPHRHSFHASVTYPTCTEGGFTSHSCGCGYGFTSDPTEALGHFYSAGFCSRCGKEDPDGSFDEGADVLFRLGEAKGKAGEVIRLPLTIQSKVEINSIAVLRLIFNEDLLEFVGFENYEAFESKAIMSCFDNDWRVITAGFASPRTFDEKICDLVFRVKDGAELNGGTAVQFSSIVKLDSNEVSSAVSSGKISASSVGDINGDRLVDIDDAILLFRHSMLPEVYPLGYGNSGDINRDSLVDIDDAILLFRHSMLPDVYPIS